jgi:hypothetical protein
MRPIHLNRSVGAAIGADQGPTVLNPLDEERAGDLAIRQYGAFVYAAAFGSFVTLAWAASSLFHLIG